MCVEIQIGTDSKVALLETDSSDYLVPFCFPDQTVFISEGMKFLTRIPIVDAPGDTSLISVETARIRIPEREAVGKGLEAYIIESYSDGRGGKVNGVILELGVPIDDLGIIFVGK